MILRVGVDGVLDKVKLTVDNGLPLLIRQVLGQLAEQGAPVVPCGVVGEVLLDLCGCKVELRLRSVEDLIVCTLVLQVELSDDIPPVIPSVDYTNIQIKGGQGGW